MENITIFSHTIKGLKLHIPTITDKNSILDMLYFSVAESLKSKHTPSVQIRPDVYNILYDYLDSILEYDDMHLLHVIVDRLYALSVQILESEAFAYLNGRFDEILDVQYRYHPGEKYVKFFIYFGKMDN